MTMWVARDKSDFLCIFEDVKPVYKDGEWDADTLKCCVIDSNMFTDVTYENSPVEYVKSNKAVIN